MKKYKLIFGTDFNNKITLDSQENLPYYDNKNNKTVGDIKDFITCFNDKICTCMLKLYQYQGSLFGSYIKYKGENEDSKKLNEIVGTDSAIYIAQIKKDCTCNFLKNNITNIPFQKRSLIEKLNELEKTKELKTFKEEDFYDIIIDINSISAIKKGWNIEFTERGRQKYDQYKKDPLIKIGIVGNVNNGKSFILSKLSKIELPTGTSISTKGLSIKYPDLGDGHEHRKYILMDSAGLENPILTDENEEGEEEEREEIAKNYKEEIDKFRLKARDILITESFLQSFIISTSDLLLVVIDKLSFSEQKLINKIKGEIKTNKIKKQIFIIHNLKTYRTKEQMESYIKDTLNKSATFKLRTGESITSNRKKVKNGIYFTEENNSNDFSVFHLLFAADGSEAGNYYNDYTIDFIEEKYNNDLNKKKFDVIEEVKSKFVEYSSRYLTEKIDINDINSNEESLNDKLIKFNGKKDLILKKCQIDEIGFQTFKKNGFEPRYNYFKNGNCLEIRAELPGNVKPVVNKPQYLDENTIISLYGEKKKDKDPEKLEDNYFNSREFGNFNLEIPLKTSDFKINPSIKENKIKNGILFLKYDFYTDEKDEKISLTVDEEI